MGWFRIARASCVVCAGFALAAVAHGPVADGAEFPENPDAPSSFSTRIQAREYDDRFATVEEVLSEVPGVRVRRFGGLGGMSTASIRGSSAEQVLVLLDGVPLNSAQRGAVDLSTIPLRQVETIDVIRGGSASARYGSGAIGGVISIRTRRPDEDLAVDFSGTTGRYETLGADASVSLNRGPFRALASYNRLQAENDFSFDHGCNFSGGICDLPFPIPDSRVTRINADFLEQGGLGNAFYKTGRASELSGMLQLGWKDRGQPGVTSALVTSDDPELVNSPDSSESFARGVGRIGWQHQNLGPGAFESNFYHRYERTKFHDPEGRLIRPSALNGKTRIQAINQGTGGELGYVTHRKRVGPFAISSRSHLSLESESVRADLVDDPAQWLGLWSVQSDLEFFEGRLRLLPAFGLEKAWTEETTVQSPSTGGPLRVQPDDSLEAIPEIGLIADVTSFARVKANWGRSFRRPNFNELFFPNLGFIRGNPFLKPEDGWGWDVGMELRPPRFGPVHGVALEAVWFDRDVDDEIGLAQVNSRTREWTNFASSRRRGLELAGSLVAFERLELSGTYTWIDTEDDDTGDTLPLSPRNTWFARAALRLGLARVWVEGRYEDEMFFDELLTFGIDDSHQFDVGVTVYLDQLPGLGRVPGGLTLTSEWTNITDEHRVEGIGLPLPGSYWTLRLRGRFTAGGEGL